MYNVLVIEDERSFLRFLQHSLKEYKTKCISYWEEFENEMIEIENYNLIVCDYFLGSVYTANDVLLKLRNNDINIPVIVISADSAEQQLSSVFKYENARFILKDNLKYLPDLVESTIKEYCIENNYQKILNNVINLLFEIAKTTNLIIQTDIEQIDVKEILSSFSNLLNVSRSFIFERKDYNNVCEYILKYDWCKNNFACDHIACLPDWKQIHCNQNKSFIEHIENGKYITFNIDELLENDQEIFKSQGVKSFAILPVFNKDGEVWGFLGLYDCDDFRVWSKLELNALQALSAIIGTLIFKIYEHNKINKERKKIASLMDDLNSKLLETQNRVLKRIK